MKLGIISDTHLSQPLPDLQELLAGPFQDVALILHAGDIVELAVLGAFAGREIRAVCGNMDSAAARHCLPPLRTISVAGFKIGLIHGWNGPQGIEERIRKEFKEVDCIVYGHTHTPGRANRDGVFFFNPGSFAGNRSGPNRSVGLLELGEEISGEIIFL